MPTADFAAAQARIAARRRDREAQAHALQTSQQAAHSAALAKLPYPFSSVGTAGLSIWDSIKGREGTRPAFRVGQVDAELLDEELLELMKAQVGEGLKYYGSHLRDDYGAEILLVLRAILFKLTLWDHNSSYGASLQGLRYTDARDASPARPPPRNWQKGIYGLVTVVGRYAWVKWEDKLLDAESGYDEPSPLLRRLSRLTGLLTTTHDVAALASFLVFLLNGKYRTLLDRILRLRLTPTSAHTSREVSFEYLNRQLVWHAFTEFLLFLLPLVGISRWRRILARSWRRAKSFFTRTPSEDEEVIKGGELGFLPERTCAICYKSLNPTSGGGEDAALAASVAGSGVVGSAQTDVTNPYETVPCGDVYCFVCIAHAIESEEGEGWTCLRCGETVKECKPWNGDVVEETVTSRPGSGGKSVGFADVEKSYMKVDDSEAEMQDVDPQPLDDEQDDEATREADSSTEMLAGSGLDDSSEWARASEVVRAGGEELETETEVTETEDDEQSEEYDEEEDEGSDFEVE